MVNSKKLLSFFLAVVMVFSVLSVAASAYTTVDSAVSGDMNFKYTVEKVDKVPGSELSAEYVADNIYAVTVWMQCNDPVNVFTVPLHYNKAHFAPIMLSDGEFSYPAGVGQDQDTWFTDMSESAVYAYSLGDYMNNTGMYTATGAVAKTYALAKCVGLGNSNSKGIDIVAELVSPDHALYSSWSKGLPADTGIMYVNLNVATNKAKTAYFNTIDGITTSTDWNRMFTFYFETITDEDVTGDEFGIFTDDCFGIDGTTDTNLPYFVSATAVKIGNPNKNIAGNAVVEAAVTAKPVYWVKNQVQWADQAAGTINLGVVAGFKASDIGIKFSDGTDGNVKGFSTNVTAVGAELAIDGVPVDGATSGFVYETTKDGELAYNFRIVLKNVDPANNAKYTVTPYVIIDGKTEYGNAIEISDEKIDSYVETKLS